MEVGLGPSHFALDGDPAPLQKRGTAPNFRPMFVVTKQLDGSRCYLAGKWASAQATLLMTNPIIFIAILPTVHTVF